MAVEAEPVTLLLYPRMETPAVPPEADTEKILVLGGVSQQETSLGLLVQQRFCLVPGNIMAPISVLIQFCYLETQKNIEQLIKLSSLRASLAQA